MSGSLVKIVECWTLGCHLQQDHPGFLCLKCKHFEQNGQTQPIDQDAVNNLVKLLSTSSDEQIDQLIDGPEMIKGANNLRKLLALYLGEDSDLK